MVFSFITFPFWIYSQTCWPICVNGSWNSKSWNFKSLTCSTTDTCFWIVFNSKYTNTNNKVYLFFKGHLTNDLFNI